MISGEPTGSAKNPGFLTRSREGAGRFISNNWGRVKRNWKTATTFTILGAAAIAVAEHRSTVSSAINQEPVKVTGELQGEQIPLPKKVISIDPTTDAIFPNAYEGTIWVCIKADRSKVCNEHIVDVTQEDLAEGRASRHDNQLTVEQSMLDTGRPFTIVTHPGKETK